MNRGKPPGFDRGHRPPPPPGFDRGYPPPPPRKTTPLSAFTTIVIVVVLVIAYIYMKSHNLI